jgi:hypothetical protein
VVTGARASTITVRASQLADWLGHHDPAFTVATYVGQVDEGLGDAGFLDELIPPGRNRGATPVQSGEAQRL